jgi:hypothetical protein
MQNELTSGINQVGARHLKKKLSNWTRNIGVNDVTLIHGLYIESHAHRVSK